MIQAISASVRGLADFVVPPACAVCGEHGEGPLCGACSVKMARLAAEPACPRCAMSLPMGAACPHCVAGRARPFGRIVRLGAFDDPLRRLIYDLKYRGAWRLADELARRLCASAVAGELLHCAEVFVAVPLHPRRHIVRGYNQAELVARRLARLLHKRHARALVRVRDTVSQTGLTAMADRQSNVRDAFALVSSWGLKGRRVVLVDDVMTSGATLRSAAGALAGAEPAELTAAVLAVADPRHRGFEAI